MKCKVLLYSIVMINNACSSLNLVFIVALHSSSIQPPPAGTSKAVEIAIGVVKHQPEVDQQWIMARTDQKCKEEIQKVKKVMEERMLKVQQASHDVPLVCCVAVK